MKRPIQNRESVTADKTTTGQKVAFLEQRGSYPHCVKDAKKKETHMSWVFLAGDYVYKLKKPVKYRLFDHRSIESRHHNSLEEVRINLPLAKSIYLGVVPLVINEAGNMELDAKGEPVDWLVKMKRIPEENMLDYAIQHRRVNEAHLQKAALLLTKFYKAAPPIPMTAAEYIKKLESEIKFNYDQLAAPLFGLPVDLLKELTAGQTAFLAAHQSAFEKRIENGKIVDAHGDLRPEHIGLSDQPVIIDRLEFSRFLRIMDIAEELSFLCMECEMLGNARAGDLFMDIYQQSTNDTIPRALILFYKIKRALLRAYLVARHIEETSYKDDPKWILKADAYLQLAENYHQQLIT
jgi:aminoglycoside phosphotransferase family enzyme